MIDVPTIRGGLLKAVRAIRAVTRSLGGGRESQDTFSQQAVLLLFDILDLLYHIQEQLSWSDEKWVTSQTRLNVLEQFVGSLNSTLDGLDVGFQTGGVGSRLHRKSLLERIFLDRLELYKSVFAVAMQPESPEKKSVVQQLRTRIRTSIDLGSMCSRPSSQCSGDFCDITSSWTSRSYTTLRNIYQERENGTCQWVCEEELYKSWLFGCLRTLYCIGPAGAGKTFLASSIVEKLQNTFTSPDVAIVFLFLEDEKQDDTVSLISMLATVLAQLVHRKRSASNTTALLYQSECFAKRGVSAKSYQNAIRAEINHFTKVFIIIDGLDSFNEKERILNRFHQLPDHAQLLITLRESRNDLDVDSIPVLAPRRDILRYVDSRINRDADLSALLKLFTLEDKLRKAIAQQVAKRSHGLFLLARLHMDLIIRCKDTNLLEKTLLRLPESLNDIYAESMKQLASRNLYASRCIFWTLYACRPLSVAELKSAVFFEPQNGAAAAHNEGATFRQVLDVETAGLLSIDPTTEAVYLVHNTAREYLSGAVARVFFPTAREHIAETCLTVIASDEVVDHCYLDNDITPDSLRNNLSGYAATYWGQHVQDAPEDEQTTQVLVRAFLNKLSWRRPLPINGSKSGELNIPTSLGLGKYFHDWSALHILAYFGVLEKAKRQIEKGDDVDDHDNCMGVTPLHCAAHRGHEEVVILLLEYGADINASCNNGNTAMHYAAGQGQKKILKIFLAHRANLGAPNRQGMTALQLAVGTVYDEAIAPMLMRSRSDLDAQNPLTGNTALHVAVELRRTRILHTLLDKGANVNVFNKQSLTPLQLAAKIGNLEALSALLERGAKVEICSLLGLTALHIAAEERNWIAFDLLLIAGADINAWKNDGESLLHEQARCASNVSIAAHLLENGADIEARTSQGYTPLQCAAISGNKTMLLFFDDNGAKIDVQTPLGESLLHITPPLSQNHLDILSMLIDWGLDVNAVCTKGWTPLLQTVFTGTDAPDIEFDKTSEYIQLLLSRGADLNTRSASSTAETALHLATLSSTPRPSLISFLVDHGASINSKTVDGKTPLHLAAERGRESIFHTLIGAGADLTLKIPNNNNMIGCDADDSEGFEDDATTPTTIDSVDSRSETDDETGGSTLVEDEGSQWGSVTSSQVVSIID